MTINVEQLRTEIIEKSLKNITTHFYSESAVNLLLGTCAQESHCGTWIKQINGPALGIYQMESPTYWDLNLYLKTRQSNLLERGLAQCGLTETPPASALVYNLRFATFMARAHYFRRPEPLPAPDDIEGLGQYWKKFYNTEKGKGTVDEFVENYHKFIR